MADAVFRQLTASAKLPPASESFSTNFALDSFGGTDHFHSFGVETLPFFKEQHGMSQHLLGAWSLTVSADLGALTQRSQADRAATSVLSFNPATALASLLGQTRLTVGIYNNAHPSGFSFNTPVAKDTMTDAWTLLSAPQQSLDEVVQKIDAELLAGSGKTPPPPAPPPLPKQQLFTYAFSGLQLSFDGPDVPNIGRRHVTVTLLGGGCGTAVLADWKGIFQVSALGPPSAAWSTPLTSGASALVYTWSFTDTTSGATGQVQMNVIFLAGSPPKVGIRWTSTGDIANVAVTPDVAPTVTPVTSC